MLDLLTSLLNTYGLGAIFTLISAEYLGLPLPTELAYIAGERMASLRFVSYTTVFFVIMSAHLLGSQLSYELGRRSSRMICKNHAASGIQRKLESWYKKYGVVTVLLTQLIGHVRPWASYVAGFSGIRRRTFLLLSMSGSAILTTVMLILADVLVRIWETYPLLRAGIIAVFGLVVLVMAYMTYNALAKRPTATKSKKK